MICQPDQHFETARKPSSLKHKLKEVTPLYNQLKTHKYKLLISLLLLGVSFVCAWLIPFTFQKVIDVGVSDGSMYFVYLFLIAQLCLFIGNLIASSVNNIILFKIGLNVGLDISTNYIKKITRLSLKIFDSKLGTDLLQRLNDSDKVSGFLTYTINSIILSVLNLLVYSSVLLFYNGYIFLIFLVFSSCIMLLAKVILKQQKQINYTLFSSYSVKKNIEYELVNGMIEIKTNNAQDIQLSKWEDLQKSINKTSLRSLFLNYYLNTGSSLFNVLRDILITALCAYLVINGNLTLGIMMTITYILGQLSGAVGMISSFLKSYQDSTLSLQRIEEIHKLPDENTVERKPLDEAYSVKSGLYVDNIDFKYDGTFNNNVLIDLKLQIPIKKVTAIIGHSGSGKTTLMKLLLGFYNPTKGNIYLDDFALSTIDSNSWHQRCGVVMQDGYIFSDTVARNIALSEPTPDLERLQEAVRIACIDEYINGLPMGFNTKIGKSGIGLSGGQKQRILIARAVYKNPEFIFFDEATSSLDANNETEIMNNLRQFYMGRTVVIIAHRLSTVKDADNIIVLEHGRIVEQGNHSELTKHQGVYYNLVKNQLELGN